ncbi:allose ABC transporter permease [Escherichia coli]|uniref:ABC transporter permease subunit n=1 Tax=Escherichia coli TaxID=562 RepID=UPI0001F65BDF|nr:hypothetical protein [Escherichia coli]EFZ2274054.1 allose ABC transporter permease [Shigella sonnei]AVV69227.1 allose ABC transporter permease [Escherichia coli]AVV73692.1 allose ABC transporter permease [Escherichia coli]EAA3119220.1 allose ABC transporter permease [Escherichia coli]EAB6056043.1 allose ABC transporter permease [Escherichia coli]
MGFTTRVKSEASEKKPFNFALFWDKYGTFFILAIIVAIFGSLSSEYFLTTNNITQIFVQSSVTVLIGMGEFFAILVAGIDLSVGAILALSGMGFETYAIASAIIGGTSFFGGKGRIFSVVIGGLIIGTINNGLNILQVQTYYQLVVMGGLIIAAVALDRLISK